MTFPTTDCSIEIAIPSTTNATTVPFRPQRRPVRRKTDGSTTGTGTEIEIIPPGQLTRAEYVEHICAAYARTVAAIIVVGLWLIKARNGLDHGEYEAMVREDLPFLPPYAYKFRTVAANPVLSNPSHGKDLPASVSTLYELTFIKDETLLALIESGKITPKLERKEAHALRPPKKRPVRQRVPEHADESALPPEEWSDGTPAERTDEEETTTTESEHWSPGCDSEPYDEEEVSEPGDSEQTVHTRVVIARLSEIARHCREALDYLRSGLDPQLLPELSSQRIEATRSWQELMSQLPEAPSI
jgi:hypothetical protein